MPGQILAEPLNVKIASCSLEIERIRTHPDLDREPPPAIAALAHRPCRPLGLFSQSTAAVFCPLDDRLY